MAFVYLLTAVIFFKCALVSTQNNVCPSIFGYLTMQINPTCWHNEDVGKTPEEIMQRFNYKFKTYEVITEDGYLLHVYRIPSKRGKKKPVLLLHGLFTESQMYLARGNISQAFVLNDEGYDVWLGNFRGTIHSNKHIDKNISKAKYWNFSFQEMGFFDIPALMDYISKIRKNEGLRDEKVTIIAWAMGCAASTIYAAVNHTHADQNVDGLICTSPLIYANHLTNPGVYLSFVLLNTLKPVTHFAGLEYLGIHTENDKKFIYTICLKIPVIRSLCDVALYLYLATKVPAEGLPMILSGFGGTSLRNFEHFGQLTTAEKQLRLRDLGESRNIEIYNQKTPPIVNMSTINIKYRLLYGDADGVGSAKDVLNFADDMKKLGKDVATIRIGNQKHGYSHADFIYARDIKDELYRTLLRVLYRI